MLLSKKALLAAMFVAGLTSGARAIDIKWDGGNGNWDDPKWNGGKLVTDFTNDVKGSNGWKGGNGEVENFIINSGVVKYDANAIPGDFRMKQGSTLTIGTGAEWAQLSNDEWSENRWTEMDASRLTINGTFRRTGAVNEEGGGALIFGSWRGDDNFDFPESLDHFEQLIEVTNGGKLINEGQLWFGAWGDLPKNGTKITMVINNGTVDLTGGDVSIDPDEVPAQGDLVFTNHYLEPENQPTYAINFTGPGTFIVDATGIVNTHINDLGEWVGTDPISYQTLWDQGVLQADGKSGKTGASFAQYFTVVGQVGKDNYTLTRSGVVTLPGDFDKDGQLTAADIDALSGQVRAGTNNVAYDLNNDAKVNQEDRAVWIVGLKKTYVGDADLNGQFDSGDFVVVFQKGKYEVANANAGWADGDWTGDTNFDSGDFVAAFQAGGYEKGPRAAVSAVPEPSSAVLFALGLLGFARRSRRS